jgi:hypothetical protein
MENALVSAGFEELAARLELNGRFPPDADLDAAWAHGLAAFRSRRSR